MSAIATRPQTATPSPLRNMAQRFDIDPNKLLDVLKSVVIKPSKGRQATNEEIAAFVMVANEYQLNPLTRQIHAFTDKSGGIVPVVGVDGWVSLVNRHPSFDGCKFVEERDELGAPICTTCIMFVKGRSYPIEVTEWFAECRRESGPWQTMPRRMLRHKAYIQAARLCFGFSGIYDEDEAGDIIGVAIKEKASPAERLAAKLSERRGNGSPALLVAPSADVEPEASEPPKIRPAQLNALRALIEEKAVILDAFLSDWQVAALEDLTAEQADTARGQLMAMRAPGEEG